MSTFLTAALIVRDEAARIDACLDSLWPHVDSIVVGDTGSSDDTAERCRRAGAQVLEVPWTDDFSAARNAVLEAVQSPWALSVDADERLEVDFGVDLRAWLSAQDLCDFGRVEVYSTGTPERERPVRLLRVDRGVRFRYPVHEQVDTDARRGADAPCKLQHVGYADPSEVAAKQERYLAMLSSLPEDHPHRVLFTVRSLVSLGRWAEVEEWARRWEALGYEGPIDAQLRFQAAVAASNRNDWRTALSWVWSGVERYPESPDLLLVGMAVAGDRYLKALDAVEDPSHPLHGRGDQSAQWRQAVITFLQALAQPG